MMKTSGGCACSSETAGLRVEGAKGELKEEEWHRTEDGERRWSRQAAGYVAKNTESCNQCAAGCRPCFPMCRIDRYVAGGNTVLH